MKIGILGSGDVGKALAAGFLKHGHAVMMGTRNAAKLAEWERQTGTRASVGSFADAAAFGTVLVLAVKGTAALNALELAGANNLAGKTVLDATNPIADEAPVDGVLRFFTGPNESLMERLQEANPKANFVKCFNSIGHAHMVNPEFGNAQPTMFVCGNDSRAKAATAGILEQFGFEAQDMGTAPAARAIEPLCMLWCIPGLRENRWNHAFKLLTK